ncbi:MAG TPA: metallophosphoesterase [Bacillus sp. (in: firmicutes)]|jgi:putative phosphoesterase|nr:metallophosphoesterase [Bacillus sp. (in: firmicutes)]
MYIGLISDTHDNIYNIEKFVKICRDKNIDLVIHAGDIVRPESVKSFEGVRLIGVLGNNDIEEERLSLSFQKIGGELKGDFCEIEQDNVLIAVYHGTNAKKKSLVLQSGKYDILVCGHTHKLEEMQVGKTLLINPGTANGWFFGYKATAAIFDTERRKAEFISL